MHNKKRILILGGDSFIAKAFVKEYCNIYKFKLISRITTSFKCEKVLDDFFLIQEAEFSDIDIVINFAAIVHRPKIRSFDVYEKYNFHLTVINGNKAKKAGVSHFLQMSTIAVYGNQEYISPNTPEYPDTFYGKSKLNADLELLKLRDDQFNITIIRPPMVYGGGLAPGNMLRLIKLVNKNIPLPFKGIKNQRDFININNLTQCLHIIIGENLTGIILVKDNQPVSTEYLIKTISRRLKKRERLFKLNNLFLIIINFFATNIYVKLFGSLRIESNFKYEKLIKKHTIEQGISEMVESFLEGSKTSNI